MRTHTFQVTRKLAQMRRRRSRAPLQPSGGVRAFLLLARIFLFFDRHDTNSLFTKLEHTHTHTCVYKYVGCGMPESRIDGTREREREKRPRDHIAPGTKQTFRERLLLLFFSRIFNVISHSIPNSTEEKQVKSDKRTGVTEKPIELLLCNRNHARSSEGRQAPSPAAFCNKNVRKNKG